MAMTLWIRRIHLFVAWTFVAAILFQVFLIGRFLFAGESVDPHREFGYTVLPLLALLVLLTAFPSGLGRGAVGWAGLLFVLTIVQMSLPGLKANLPLVAALHPVNALLVFWFAVRVARGAGRPVMNPSRAAVPSRSVAAQLR
jgi:hypothetical protein